MDLLTRMEEIILLCVHHLAEEAYGIAIREYIVELTGEEMSVGAVYVPLERLEQRGLLESYLGEPTPERGGRGKRFYRLTPDGISALRAARQVHERLWAGVEL
jgi:PadR family transcriptional regulator, regulatory protein PadR